jgi:endoglucanase
VSGDKIVDGQGEPVLMQGIAFGNEVWNHVQIPSAHHSGSDFEVVQSMGMNVVRFYLSYHTFEDDSSPFHYKESGWAWLDQNVEWAKSANVRLILNMHDPVGGYQSLGKGAHLWTDERSQTRFIELWRAIAERYRAEPMIAGFDLLNEPIPTKNIEQWQDLAQRAIAEIRQVDQHHMVFVERVNALLKEEGEADWSENVDRNFFLVPDKNVVYEFHFYKPFHFTHQNATWVPFTSAESWYPDPQSPEVDSFELTKVASAESTVLPVGNSDWTFLETDPFVVADPNIVVGKPFLVCDKGEGKATFDALSLSRIDAAAGASTTTANSQGAEPEVQFEMDLDTLRGWNFWKKEDEKGEAYFDLKGHGDSTALSIEQSSGPAHLSSDPLRFFTQPGSEYTLRALARGQGLGEQARCLIRLEFYSSRVPVLPRGKAALEQQLDAYLAWGKKHEVPLFLGEFGAIRQSFVPGRGGLSWASDMIEAVKDRQLHFTYHSYHETPFGLFSDKGELPSAAELNRPLYDVLVKKLGGTGTLPWPLTEPAASEGLEKE